MTRIRKTVCIVTAIILCVLTFGTPGYTMLCSEDGDIRNAQFFAMPFSLSIAEEAPPSLAPSGRKAIITWLKKRESVCEDEDVYKLTGGSFSLITSAAGAGEIQSFKRDLYNLSHNVTYYMRI